MGYPHALVLSFPAQGHVIPLVELSYCLVDCGFKITFVNTQFNHNRVTAAFSNRDDSEMDHIQLISIPDGLGPREDRNDLTRLTNSFLKTMPRYLEELIRKTNDHSLLICTCPTC